MKDREYIDRTILALRLKYKEYVEEGSFLEDKVFIGTEKIPLQREELFEGKCSILLPSILTDMDKRTQRIKYKNENRPPIIKGDSGQNAAITFQMIKEEKETSRKSIIEKREVEGENDKVAWMDFKSFCLDNQLYCLIFLFYIEEQIVLGNFHCLFPQYNLWKPAILKSIGTVQING